MYDDVIDLRDFYRSSLGQAARRVLRPRLRLIWPNLSGLSLLGFGYATPYLSSFQGEAAQIIAAMPAGQGVLHWPPDGANQTLLVDDCDLPFPDASIDRVLMVHALERTEHLRPLLREIWRVLAGNGRLLVLVPNRRGIWARFDRTPFGHGSPFSTGQLSRLLRDTQFTPVQSGSALFVPPTSNRMLLKAAPAWEEIGGRWFPSFAGVVLLEATKQIYAIPSARHLARRRLLPSLEQASPATRAGVG